MSEKSLRNAIEAHLEDFASEAELESASHQGALSLLLEQAQAALTENDEQKVLDLLVEVARVAMGVGITRGRFDLAKEIIDIMGMRGGNEPAGG